MNLVNTHVFKFIYFIILDLWSESTGKIFLLTIIAYSISYVVYSGYLSWFSGGFGSVSLSQIGLTVIDFLGFIPTVYLLIIQILSKRIPRLLLYILIYFILPALTLYFVSENLGSIQYSNQSETFKLAGLILWMLGMILGNVFYDNKLSVLSLAFSFIGAVILGLSNGLSANTTGNVGNLGQQPINWLNELLSITLLIFLPVFIYSIGQGLAILTVENRFLSKIDKLVFTSQIEMEGLIRDNKSKNEKDNFFSYKVNSEKPIYLFSMLSKTTILYLPQGTIKKENGRLVFISNDAIRLLRVKSGKLDETEITMSKNKWLGISLTW